jgi:preprotein translocase subunit YajC
MYATVTAVDGDDVILEVAPGVEVRYLRRAVMDIIAPGEAEEPETAEDDEPEDVDEYAEDDHDEYAEDDQPEDGHPQDAKPSAVNDSVHTVNDSVNKGNAF